MIIWIASYPKSGNTYVRSFLSSYYYSKKGKFDFELLLNIKQFPALKYSSKKAYTYVDAAKNWIPNQKSFFKKDQYYFLKTHNSLEEYFGNKFTTSSETIGGIYIVRDPRNVLDSMSRHFQIDHDKAIEVMQDKKNFTYDFKKKNDYSDYQFISSWELNYQSWKNNKLLPIKFFKYEDLLSETFFSASFNI